MQFRKAVFVTALAALLSSQTAHAWFSGEFQAAQDNWMVSSFQGWACTDFYPQFTQQSFSIVVHIGGPVGYSSASYEFASATRYSSDGAKYCYGFDSAGFDGIGWGGIAGQPVWAYVKRTSDGQLFMLNGSPKIAYHP